MKAQKLLKTLILNLEQTYPRHVGTFDLIDYPNLQKFNCNEHFGITKIINIPDSLTELECCLNNISVLSLPPNLTYLCCDNDVKFNTPFPKSLKILNICDKEYDDGMDKYKWTQYYDMSERYMRSSKSINDYVEENKHLFE